MLFKFIRHIAFFLAIAVIAGHDMIPHVHNVDSDALEDAAIAPHLSSAGETSLAHLLSHFKHGSLESPSAAQVIAREKGSDYHQLADVIFLPAYTNGLTWFADLKKHRFKNPVPLVTAHFYLSHSLRGPPVHGNQA